MNAVEKDMIQKRINHLNTEAEHGKKLMVGNPYNGKVWQGRVSAITGEDGEIKFLQKLLEMGDDI